MSDTIILNHYKKVAKNNGLSGSCSMEDPHIRDEETQFILDQIRVLTKRKKKLRVLDAGCGNGYLLSRIREEFPSLELHGIEFTPELFKLAHGRKLENTTITHGDIRKKEFFDGKFDIIITERVIINVLVKKDQYTALDNIQEHLNMGGHYIQIESYREALLEINKARKELCLPPLEESYQNRYLTDTSLGRMRDRGMKHIQAVRAPNHLSSYFYITRVFYKVVRPSGAKLKYTCFDLFFKEALPPAIGNYSPIKFYLFKKESEIVWKRKK